MLEEIKPEDILFLDIETVPSYPSFSEGSPEIQKFWELKSRSLRETEDQSPADIWSRAGIYAEFGKIVCISVGFILQEDGKTGFRSKSFYGDDEKQLLEEFAVLLNSHYKDPRKRLCAHNGKEFDFPYIARRMVINRVPIPSILDTAGKKPWEVQHLDTMELWKFGDRKSFTSVALLTHILGIPSPKDDIDGSEVGRVYWEEKDLDRIEKYCRKDVLAVAQIYLRFKGLPLIEHEE